LDKLIQWGWSPDKFIHIPNFVALEQYNPCFDTGDAFLYFGRLSREKGLATLIRAAAIVGTPLRIAGTGPDEKVLKDLAVSLDAKVEFLGYLSGSALHAAICSARAVVLPSEWYENAPMSILESYALGKPVIGADIGGIPELIRDQETGFIFHSASEHALAEILQKVAGLSVGHLSDIGRCGRDWVEGTFSREKYRDRMLSLYRTLGVSC
jgi:glycosyltransferase involved in cell wall biosynthesis